jgi:hypothetical protein
MESTILRTAGPITGGSTTDFDPSTGTARPPVYVLGAGPENKRTLYGCWLLMTVFLGKGLYFIDPAQASLQPSAGMVDGGLFVLHPADQGFRCPPRTCGGIFLLLALLFCIIQPHPSPFISSGCYGGRGERIHRRAGHPLMLLIPLLLILGKPPRWKW